MKKHFQILFLFLISFSLFAQEKQDSLNQTESKWSIQLLGGTNYCFPTFHFPNSYNSSVGKGLYQYGAKVIVNGKVSKYAVINFGASYNFLKYSDWLSYSPSYIHYFDYSFASFLLSFRQIINSGKLYGHIEFGLTGDYLLDNNYTNNSPNGPMYIFPSRIKVFPNKTITASLYISPGINYKINDKITLNAMIGFSKAIIPLKYVDNSTASGAPKKANNYYSYLMYNAGIQYNF